MPWCRSQPCRTQDPGHRTEHTSLTGEVAYTQTGQETKESNTQKDTGKVEGKTPCLQSQIQVLHVSRAKCCGDRSRVYLKPAEPEQSSLEQF